MASKSQSSIIKIIQDMVKSGESEKKIMDTLKELGVQPEQARKLLMLGQADTFAVLEGEIGKLSRMQVESAIPELKAEMQKELRKTQKSLEETVDEYLEEEAKNLKKKFSEQMKLVNEVNSAMNEKLDKIAGEVNDLRRELKEMQLRRLGTKNEWVTLLLVLGGVAFLGSALYFFFVMAQTITLDSIIIFIIICLTGITMLFSSTIV